MRSNHVDLISTILISCLILASLPGLKSDRKIPKGTSRAARTRELARNHKLSSPKECGRTCYDGEPPKTCYYHFVLENYVVLGSACQVCTPNNTNSLKYNCQCVTADGVERSILTANRMLPGPSIEVCKGDKVVVDVENKMEGLEVTIHWHGVFQEGSQYYDGVPFVTQCPIRQGETFRYQWMAANAGTHFWHSHTGLQKLDGLSGPVIVRETLSEDPAGHLYDKDLSHHVTHIDDWMHEGATGRFPGRLETGRGQTPASILINGKGQFMDPKNGSRTHTPLEVFTVKPNYKYRFRMICNICSVCPVQINIHNHTMTVIATDGEPVHPVDVGTIICFAGERYDFVIEAIQKAASYWIQMRAGGECGRDKVQQLAILRYKGQPDKEPYSKRPTYDRGLPNGVVLNPYDAICDKPRKDAVCINQLKSARPVDKEILEPKPDVKIFLPFRFHRWKPEELFQCETYNHYLVAPSGSLVTSIIDNISYKPASSPPLSQKHDISYEELCNGDDKPGDFGDFRTCTHTINVPLNCMTEIVLVDEVGAQFLSHPFHLHGHTFSVIGMGRSPDKNVTKMSLKHARDLDKHGLLYKKFHLPPSKDTIAVPNNGYVVLRFRAINPGYWIFHCHFLYHTTIGMDVIIRVGTKEDLPPVPHGFPVCGNYVPPIKFIDEDPVCLEKIASHENRKPRNVSLYKRNQDKHGSE